MARRLSIEEIPSWVLGDAPPLAAVLGGAAAPSTASHTQPLPYSTASAPADSHWRHPSFERALHGLLADIRDRSAPVIVLTGEAGTGKTLLVQCAWQARPRCDSGSAQPSPLVVPGFSGVRMPPA
ncbi:MAG: ATP-binding protein [Sterolibacteriaceae bacterium]|nr:ATP-binding protein [Candidatus Methylophosphatis haderslevensis]